MQGCNRIMNIQSSKKTDKHPQVVSKKRVAAYGEVYTGKREVNAMLDLVKQETERIESRFLEPACGIGNFLAEILERKLRVAEKKYRKSLAEYEFNAVIAVSSIYGIDLLEDNVAACRQRLLGIFDWKFKSLFKEDLRNVVKFILERNIIWGDALTLMTADNPAKPIIFSEWSPVNGCIIKRRDFAFHQLVYYAGLKDKPLFSDLGEEIFIPEPVKEYPATHYLRLPDADS